MKKRSIDKIVLQIISWVLLIQVINISIDPIDPLSDKLGRLSTEEDLSINDIESIYELVSEQCLGLDIPENDEDDESGFVKVIATYLPHEPVIFNNEYQDCEVKFLVAEKNFNSVILDHTSPPPKVA